MSVWLAQRLHRVPARKSQLVTWVNLDDQFGQGFERLRDFRQVMAVYPAAKLDVDEGGVSRWTSPPPVASRSVAVPVLPNPMSYPQVAVD